MRCNVKRLLFILMFGIAASFYSIADDKKAPLSSDMTAFVVSVDDEGKEVFTPAETVYPKDKIEYRLTYKNNTDEPLKGLVVTGPVPANTFFVSNTNNTKVNSQFLVSIDGGKNYESEPVKREIIKDGKKVEIIIPPEKYTNIRWVPKEPISGNQKQIFKYRIEVK